MSFATTNRNRAMIDLSNLATGGAFIAGLSGSAHCFGMCGGMAGALGMHARSVARTGATVFGTSALYQVGRIGGYATLGALFGALGMALSMALNLNRIADVMRMLSGALLILLGLRVLLRVNALAPLENWGARLWRHLQPLAGHAAQGNAFARPLLLGLMWGWLPCGLVYSMLMVSATSANAAGGAAVMVAFGIGTLPAMLTSTLAAARLQAVLKRRATQLASGILLVLFGTWMFVSALLMAGHVHHH
jgi:sulfite exporter TauE/SafE